MHIKTEVEIEIPDDTIHNGLIAAVIIVGMISCAVVLILG